MKFIGREPQKKSLLRFFESAEDMVALVYGRRRIGKSELIKQSLRENERTSLYYECKQTTEMNNVESLATLIAEHFAFPKPAFGSMEEVLDYLFDRGTREPLILVLDEYPYLRSRATGLDSILQSLVDKYRGASGLKLILCGSFVDTMKSLLAEENPLYGRVDLTIDLKPMDYYESALFYPSFENADKVRLYSVFGGVPYFNRLIDPELSVKENIIHLIASPGARLENEVPMYLKAEIAKITNANEVFEAMARGFSRYTDLLSQSHVSSSPTLSDVLEKLISMDVVKREAPINDEGNRRKAGYYIRDNLSLFYYSYVFRYASQMSVMDSEVFFERYIGEDFESRYVPRAFEDISRQFLIRLNRSGHMPVIFDKIGRYWYDDPATRTNGEFDIVTEDPNGLIFYDAKFRKAPVTAAMIDEEISQVKATGMNCYRYGFISRSGFAAPPDDHLAFYTLDDLYAE